MYHVINILHTMASYVASSNRYLFLVILLSLVGHATSIIFIINYFLIYMSAIQHVLCAPFFSFN